LATLSNTGLGAGPASASRSFSKRLLNGDQVAHAVTFVAAASILVITTMLVIVLWDNSALPRAKFGLSFFIGQIWDPVAEQFGAAPFVYGTLVTTAIALLVGVPLGLGAAVFLAELAPPKISDALTFVIELLAAVPSVIYGLLGIFVVVPFVRTSLAPPLMHTLGALPKIGVLFKGPCYGVSFLAAGLVMAIMIVPFIISVSREVLLAVPTDQREAALALGSTRWESTWKVVVPFALPGVLGSVFLAMARALGETMAVTMVVGNVPEIRSSLLAPGYSIAAVIANEFTEATGDIYLQSLIELGLVLFLVTFILNGLARLLILFTSRRGGTA
jgi:phosphate transport system permease protein